MYTWFLNTIYFKNAAFHYLTRFRKTESSGYMFFLTIKKLGIDRNFLTTTVFQKPTANKIWGGDILDIFALWAGWAVRPRPCPLRAPHWGHSSAWRIGNDTGPARIGRKGIKVSVCAGVNLTCILNSNESTDEGIGQTRSWSKVSEFTISLRTPTASL